MSEEIEDISVETTEIASPSATPAGGLEEAPAVPMAPVEVAEAEVSLPAEIDATKVNLNAGDSVEKQNAQQVYLENNAPDRASGTAPITVAAIDARETEKREKHEALQEHLADQLKQAERQQEWLDRTHDFGGMKISGHDLDKMIDFYANNPHMMDKLKEKMVKSGMFKDKADKGVKEFQEFMDLKKKEKEAEAAGTKLSEDQQRRLREIEKSEEFKATTVAVAEQLKSNGITTLKNQSAEAVASRSSDDREVRSAAKEKFDSKDLNQQKDIVANASAFDGFEQTSMARAKLNINEKIGFSSADAVAARENFASAPRLTTEFASSVAIKLSPLSPAANDMSFGEEVTPSLGAVAQSQAPKKIITGDVSFG